jgi:hypothetical protein
MQISKTVSLQDSQIVEITTKHYCYYNTDADVTKEVNPQVLSLSIQQIVEELVRLSSNREQCNRHRG